ncbi:MAG: PHP domain-containing protein [Methanosarcinales archaeon]|jgi:predicted metal-dependent phosphoesterase TrpH|nr:PHP domain-containing protein [Methanosarcinales archaeon]
MFKYDFHIHSKYSRDSETPLKDILRAAKNKNLNGIAICDHDEVKGGLKALEIVKENPGKYGDLVVIPGTEVSTSKGHILVLGVTEKIPSFMTPEETTDYARDLNAISIIAHPYRSSAHGIGYLKGAGADAAETFNSKCITSGSNKKARMEAEKIGMPQVGGSDAHIAELVGQGYTLVNIEVNTQENVFDAILRGKTVPAGENTPAGIIINQMKKNVVRRTRLIMSGNLKEF